MLDRNYLEFVGRISPSFGNQGWSDGYGDMPSDAEEIVRQLFGKVSVDNLVEYVKLYLQGYELGCDMSENIEEVYDEDGNIKEEWENPMSMFDHSDEAQEIILKYYNQKIARTRDKN